MAFLERAKQIYEPPSVGASYAVPLPDSELPGRSAVYRHWRFQNGLLKSMDPNVGGGESGHLTPRWRVDWPTSCLGFHGASNV